MGIPISQSKRPLPILIPLIWFVQMNVPRGMGSEIYACPVRQRMGVFAQFELSKGQTVLNYPARE